MTWEIVIKIILLGIGLSMDAFAVSVTDGLIYRDLNKKKGIFIAATFGIMQALMPLTGYWIVEGITKLVGAEQGNTAGEIMSTVVTWISFALLIFIGGKMLIEAIRDYKKPAEEKEIKNFSYKEVLIMGVATAIDALAAGVTLHAGTLTATWQIFPSSVMIMTCTFIISLLGVFLAHQIHKLLKGKYEIASIVGGIILILLAVWVVLSHYLGI